MATGVDHSSGEVLRLICETQQLLETFIQRETAAPDEAWESVVQLQEVVDRLRRLRPAKTFFPSDGLKERLADNTSAVLERSSNDFGSRQR